MPAMWLKWVLICLSVSFSTCVENSAQASTSNEFSVPFIKYFIYFDFKASDDNILSKLDNDMAKYFNYDITYSKFNSNLNVVILNSDHIDIDILDSYRSYIESYILPEGAHADNLESTVKKLYNIDSGCVPLMTRLNINEFRAIIFTKDFRKNELSARCFMRTILILSGIIVPMNPNNYKELFLESPMLYFNNKKSLLEIINKKYMMER